MLNVPIWTQKVWATDTVTTTSCKDVIEACDEALADKVSQITIRDLAIKQYRDENVLLAREVDRQESELNSVFRSPWLYFGLGVLTGKLVLGR